MSRIKVSCHWALSVSVAVILSLPGCGGDGNKTPTSPPTTLPAPVTTIVAQGGFPGLQPGFLVAITFATTASGRLEVTTDWTFASNNVDIYLVRGTNPCTYGQFNSGTCPFISRSESTTAKPERMTVTSLAADNYTLYIGNRGPTLESYSYQITLTTTSGVAAVNSSTTATPTGPWMGLGAIR